MYTEFYDLKDRPFDLSPSSRFLYLGETHKEAFALLTYGLRERQGFSLLTGEVGTGKTTIIHALLADLDRNVHLVHLSNPLLSPREFLDYLARKALGREKSFLSKAEFLIAFETFLIDCLKSGKRFLLIIDEAHKVSFELLEEIRLLSNMETAEEKLMGIFLVGQPELRERLKDPRCKALFQRITTHYHLTPLDPDSAAEYIRTRLRVAGAGTPDKIFPESVIKRILQYSGGYPRKINNIADNLLLLAFARGKRKITPEMVTECYRDMKMEVPLVGREEMPSPEEQREATPDPPPNRWKRLSLAVGFVAALTLVLAMGFVRTDMLSRSVGVKPRAGVEQRGVEEGSREATRQEGDKNTSGRQSLPRLAGLASEADPGTSSDSLFQEPVDPPVAASPTVLPQAVYVEEGPPPPADFEPPPGRTSLETMTVQEGQTLRELALEAYGEADEAVLAMLQDVNPAIEDINLIEVGQQISFPPLPVGPQLPRDLAARSVRTPAEAEHPGTPDRDIYDRIDQDILGTLKEEHPGAYLDFWEGLLCANSGGRQKDPKTSAYSQEDAKKRISRFVQVASEIESKTASDGGNPGVLQPAVLMAYNELSSLDPSSFAPLLKDSVVYREQWQGDVDLVHALAGPGEAEKEEARKRFLLVIHRPDANLRELHTLGHYALEAGWLQGAISAFSRIVEDRTPDYEAYNNRAVAYLRIGKIELARNDLNKAIEKDPTRPEAFNNMGMTYVQDKAYKDAAAYFLHAAKVEPSFHVSLLNAAVVYGQLLEKGEQATRLAREYLDRGGVFQRQMLIEWLGES